MSEDGDNLKAEEGIYKFQRLIFIGLAAGLGGFPIGYNLGIVAGVQLYMSNDYPDVTVDQKAKFVSLALLGSAFTSFIAGIVTNKIGRKLTILGADFLFIAGSLVLMMSVHVMLLYLGRFLIGMAIGFTIELDKHFKQLQAECDEANNEVSIIQGVIELVTIYRRNLLIGVALQFLQQLTGINIILFYGPSILKDSGFAGVSEQSLLGSMLFLSVMFLIGNLTYFIVSTRIGRKKLMMLCMIPMGFSILAIEIMTIINQFSSGGFKCKTNFDKNIQLEDGYVQSVCRFFQYFTQLALLLNLGLFVLKSFQQYLLYFQQRSKFIQNHIRSNANSITTITNWLTNYFLASVFIKINDGEIGKIVGYSILVFFNFFIFFFLQRYVVDTAGKSLEECVNLYKFEIVEEGPKRRRRRKQPNVNKQVGGNDFQDQENGLLDKRQNSQNTPGQVQMTQKKKVKRNDF
ncbi:sugar transporter [Stylonychia lemnae]|uniref:Sugar transporter n=1 Tax=Stylonychia lemnae TaxID=5949 RepID=A0A078B131_STYLE|nr:sugar transporter [Stylonychia lemnae]|eukprot:CDW88036.1 sugar transporter [Stylonychia lemnae]